MTPIIAIIWGALCAPILLFYVLDADAQLRFNYSLIAQIVGPLLAGVFCYYAAAAVPRSDTTRGALIFLGLGQLSWGMGAVLFAAYPMMHAGQETPYPWFSDFGYLMLYPFVFIAFGLFKKGFPVHIPLLGSVVASVFFLVALAVSMLLNLTKLGASDSPVTFLVTFFYTVGDPMLIGATLLIASLLFGGIAARPWWLILIGMVFFYMADLVYTYLALEGHYATGNPFDIGWPLSAGFVAVAALMIRNMYEELA